MYVELSERHHEPHFHVYYQGVAAVFGINNVAMIAGELPRRQQRLVEAWAELHQEELLNAWAALQKGRAPNLIAPLK